VTTAATAAYEGDFTSLAAPYRRELLAHCYRMTGSIHDAEDLVQETYLRGWRAFDRFEGRSSLRQWLYAIATRVCLTALETRSRRPLPSGLGRASDDHRAELSVVEPFGGWLQPAPDALLGVGVDGAAADPAGIVVARESVRLAFIAALQHLPARQRAVLILRDVLAWHAAEVAELLDTTTIAVNSSLQRARAQLRQVSAEPDALTEPDDPAVRATLERFVQAFEQSDVAALARLLRHDVEAEMPPHPTWFRGAETVLAFLDARVLGSPGHWRLLPVMANGQQAFASYARDADGCVRGHGIHLIDVTEGQVSRIVAFLDAALLPLFGMPVMLAEPAGPGQPLLPR
jgi:RNA polymerase sigma-70 factor (ECF subfamily)